MITVGSYLKKERLKKKLELSQVEKELRIRKKYLKAAEENRWEVFASRVYAEGVVLSYANFLGIEKENILPYFRRDYEKYEEVKFRNRIVEQDIKPFFTFTKFILFAALFLFLSFLFWQLYLFLKPPELKIISPDKTRIELRKSLYFIEGQVEEDTEVRINDNVVMPDNNGKFRQKVTLTKDENKFIIKAIGPNGRTTQKVVTIYRK